MVAIEENYFNYTETILWDEQPHNSTSDNSTDTNLWWLWLLIGILGMIIMSVIGFYLYRHIKKRSWLKKRRASEMLVNELTDF
ncbi:unnamed protein product [Blepharisma stoltei]|uniref:Uncharacterized protein n=1 Tax=Blepharisma stoltei TaxID=1481888 RepID=A0AAU9IIU7_9CILI|nr:unnamed protein product [Blepharisma stoltei]